MIRPRGGPRPQRLDPRAVRRDTAVTAESARWSSLAERASWRSAATARRWTSNRASGSAMAISSHLRSLTEKKTHMFNVPSSQLAWRRKLPADGLAILLRHSGLLMQVEAARRPPRVRVSLPPLQPPRHVPSPSPRYPKPGALITASATRTHALLRLAACAGLCRLIAREAVRPLIIRWWFVGGTGPRIAANSDQDWHTSASSQ